MPTQFWARIDSNTANNPSVNLKGDPAVFLTFRAETPDGDPGDYQIDVDPTTGRDPDTVVSIGGSTYEFSFIYSGDLPTQNRDGANQVPEQFEGEEIYLITVHDYPSAGESTRFLFMADGSATQVEMDDFGNGKINIQNQSTDPTDPDNEYVCFGAGTLIGTPKGEVAIDDLGVGDLVTTASGDALKVVWIGASRMTWPGAGENHRPYLVPGGALGKGMPKRDLILSPQHRVMLSGAPVEAMFGTPEVFAPVKGLTNLPGVRRMNGKRQVTYVHMLLERHAVILSEGATTESLYPGPVARAFIGTVKWREIEQAFPGVSRDVEGAYGPLARPCATRREAEALATALRSDLVRDVDPVLA